MFNSVLMIINLAQDKLIYDFYKIVLFFKRSCINWFVKNAKYSTAASAHGSI